MTKNPFKFGSIVDEPYFTNRISEISQVKSILNSSNHLIVISPRRFGKSSLIYKVVSQLNRPVISLDLQLLTSVEDFASQLLKRIYRLFPYEKVRQFVKQFRIIPVITINPVSNEVDVSFQAASAKLPLIEDVLNLIEQLSTEKKKVIVVFDEFQEANRIDTHLMSQLRSIMQHHQKINYVFLGSQESLIRDIFEKKNSSFYHFGLLLPLGKIPFTEFLEYLKNGFSRVTQDTDKYSNEILKFTACHPYYTQQLAYMTWEILTQQTDVESSTDQAINDLIRIHDVDYERLWNTLNKTDKKLLIGLSVSSHLRVSEAFYRKSDITSPSTAFSSLKRLAQNGYITKVDGKYEIDDPFFRQWIIIRRGR